MSNKNLVPITNDEQTDYTGIAILVTAGLGAFGMLLDYLSNHVKKAKIKCSLFERVNIEAEIEIASIYSIHKRSGRSIGRES